MCSAARNTVACVALVAAIACTPSPVVVRGADDDDDDDAGEGEGEGDEGDEGEGDEGEGDEGEGEGDEVGGEGGEGEGDLDVSSATTSFACKLISDENAEEPTANQTQTRFNIKGTDLGISVAYGDELYVLFGDTQGYRDIWAIGEDPDSVAHIPLATVRADPTSLCRSLEFFVTPGESVASDQSVERDFAGAYMIAPPGGSLADFITDPAVFAHMPGTFEVPAGAVVVNESLYVLYAGKLVTDPVYKATLGYLAKWNDVTTPGYQIVRAIDSLDAPLLGAHFVQTQAVVDGGFVWLFGTGDYRNSGVSLARVAIADFESGANTEVMGPLFEDDGVGELSVLKVDDLFLAMYQRGVPVPGGYDNRVLLRASSSPAGPWTDAITLTDMDDPAFRAAHCCASAQCVGEQLLHCENAGLYGAYMVPAVNVTLGEDGARDLDLPFLVSTWEPYNVVLMTASVHLAPL